MLPGPVSTVDGLILQSLLLAVDPSIPLQLLRTVLHASISYLQPQLVLPAFFHARQRASAAHDTILSLR